MNQPLVLVVNPGSASRKYALFAGNSERARLHFELGLGNIQCTLTTKTTRAEIPVLIKSLDEAITIVLPALRTHKVIAENEQIHSIALRIVAPGSYFLTSHRIDEEFIDRLRQAKEHAPLHATTALTELSYLQEYFPESQIFAISDSAFHHTKPDYAWNYGIALEVADTHDIKRFGYHGLSVASVVRQLSVPEKTIICHLGSGASITALDRGRSFDTTMGFSPLEGVIMGTRSGSIDLGAVNALKKLLHLDDLAIETYLNEKSGLLGLGGSADIRELLHHEQEGNLQARLALNTYIYSIQKNIGQMAAALNGADMIIFTGTVGERSAPVRKRIARRLDYLGFVIDESLNLNGVALTLNKPVPIHNPKISKPIYVIPAQEEQEMSEQLSLFISE